VSDTLPLDRILGPEQAARVLRQLANYLVYADRLHPDTALRLVCERATDGDPLLLAAPGQTWLLHDDVDPEEAPARRLAIHARLRDPDRVLVTDPDLIDSQTEELLTTVLEMYRLETWHPADTLLDEAEGDAS
jgi:hypothetical protein